MITAYGVPRAYSVLANAMPTVTICPATSDRRAVEKAAETFDVGETKHVLHLHLERCSTF